MFEGCVLRIIIFDNLAWLKFPLSLEDGMPKINCTYANGGAIVERLLLCRLTAPFEEWKRNCAI